jgi:hypothetical protein
LDYLRHSIDEANQSSHSAEEIRRYKSKEYFDGLFNGVIDKDGNSDQIPHNFEVTPLTFEGGEARLEQAIDDFAKQVSVFSRSAEDMMAMKTPQLAIKAATGLDKTSRIMSSRRKYLRSVRN